MEHCRGFLWGLVLGSVVGPFIGYAIAVFLVVVRPELVSSEIGPAPAVYTCECIGLPIGFLLGGFAGNIVDFRRRRDSASFVAMVCILVLALVLVIIPSILITLGPEYFPR